MREFAFLANQQYETQEMHSKATSETMELRSDNERLAEDLQKLHDHCENLQGAVDEKTDEIVRRCTYLSHTTPPSWS